MGVAVADIGAALPIYEKLFGYRLISGPFDDPIQRVTVCFLGTEKGATPSVELIAPLAGREDSPIHRLLKQGGGAYHLCFEVDDLEAELARWREEKCLLISPPAPAVAFGGRRIAWLMTPTRQLVELVEFYPPATDADRQRC